MECKKENNLNNCNCSYPGCPRKGICCDCIAYHRSRNELPGCYFDEKHEKKWDRSIEYYIRINNL